MDWLTAHWFDLLQVVGIVGGLFFTGWSIHLSTETERVSNLLKITEQHREIWKMAMDEPKLVRILKAKLNLSDNPVSADEARFVGFLINHLNTSFHSMKAGVLVQTEGLSADIRSFFALPIPQAVWQKSKIYYDTEFVKFVESQ